MQLNTLFYLALILFSGLIFGRLGKLLKLPNVTGYLIAGLLIGPCLFKLVPLNVTSQLTIVSEMALAFIAFSIGAEFKIPYLKKVGATPIVIAVFEALAASIVVTVVLLLFKFDIKIALVLGAIASATAPAATIMVIKQFAAKGPVTETLLSVVALDDAVALIAFGFAAAIAKSLQHPHEVSVIMSMVSPVIEIVGSILLGFLLGILFTIPLRYFKKDSNRLIITTAFVFLGSSLATMLGLSPLLLCMCMGAMLINISQAGGAILKLVDIVTPPIFLMFFVISGMELNIYVIPQIGVIGIIYVICRVVGKVAGSYLGAAMMKAPAPVKKYLGFTLIPQAGVAIGLSLVAAGDFPELGETIRTVVLCATLIYELVGPAVTKFSLEKAGEIRG
ncbi:MAG: cation:proton antiporter [Dethiobacteria bacterium]|jgi:Kef-type K+ transport system membrane component KefB|nr:cation:proton antiporter [Bacillota bacterium]NLM23976.1 cation:proton antiporter [Bacillota bacterium]HQA59598.1 cation:proton antiporter [Tepidanaerobacteraceae bacterium]